ncbi:retrovirus-related pol polyprotein from transposon TNT 1-94 [Tanacetum coccineum]
MVGAFDLEPEQLDVKTAFLHGNLEERIYMSQPEGFNNSRRDQVCLLKKSLYGLKQSLRQWYKRFDSFMVCNGYIRNQFYNCVYSKKVFRDSYVYLLLYVDDMLIAAKNIAVINDLKALLKSEFEMEDLGAAKKIMGMEIWCDKKARRLWVSQENTIPGIDKEVKYMKTVPYSSAIGSLMYAVGHGDGLVGYADSDYGGDLVKRRSLTCFIFTLFGCAVSWKSTLQPTVALSTTEVEYMSMTEGIKECIWLHGLVQSLGLKVEKLVLFSNNQSALSLAKNHVYHERTKYIDVLEEDRKETTERDTEEPLAVG